MSIPRKRRKGCRQFAIFQENFDISRSFVCPRDVYSSKEAFPHFLISIWNYHVNPRTYIRIYGHSEYFPNERLHSRVVRVGHRWDWFITESGSPTSGLVWEQTRVIAFNSFAALMSVIWPKGHKHQSRRLTSQIHSLDWTPSLPIPLASSFPFD